MARADVSEFRRADVTEPRYRGALGRYFFTVEELPVRALVGRPADTVLEIGCGTGRMFAWLARPGNLVVGIDISHDMLESARAGGIRNVALVGGDFRRLPLQDGVAGTVLALGTFHMTADLARPLAGIARVMRPGGRLVFTCWNARPWAPRALFMSPRAASHDPRSVAAMLDDAGFEDIDIRSTFFLPPYLFWGGYKLLRLDGLRHLWVDLAIRVNCACMRRESWRTAGGNLIVAARRKQAVR